MKKIMLSLVLLSFYHTKLSPTSTIVDFDVQAEVKAIFPMLEKCIATKEVEDTPLFRAAYAGDVVEIKRLFDAGQSPYEKDEQGKTLAQRCWNKGYFVAAMNLILANHE